MQEKQVTAGNETFVLDKPFFVLATQNPIEMEGTFPLPEAQLDRFLFKIQVTYPSFEEELEIVNRYTLIDIPQVQKAITKKNCSTCRDLHVKFQYLRTSNPGS